MLYFLLLTFAFGEDKNSQYQKRTEIDFEALDISGELIKPQGSIIIERSKTKFPPVIKPRLDFNLEMTHSVEEIK
jgi:hypothetical protein